MHLVFTRMTCTVVPLCLASISQEQYFSWVALQFYIHVQQTIEEEKNPTNNERRPTDTALSPRPQVSFTLSILVYALVSVLMFSLHPSEI